MSSVRSEPLPCKPLLDGLQCELLEIPYSNVVSLGHVVPRDMRYLRRETTSADLLDELVAFQ